MAIDPGFRAENARQRARLAALVGRLSDADLARSVGHGWTVADTLVHLAFWDLRAAELVDRFAKGSMSPSAADVDVVNDAVHRLGRAIPPRAAAKIAVEAAEAAERKVAALSDATLEAVERAQSFAPARHRHWAEHLDEIEGALGGTR
jgi:Mycothiol maleylpyruvate isomerase N-terminal domain